MKSNMNVKKRQGKLLAAVAVLAMVFCVFATVPAVDADNNAALEGAMDYEYPETLAEGDLFDDPDREYVGTYAVTDNNVTVSYKEINIVNSANGDETDDNFGVMNDLARYLGALHRYSGYTVQSIVYNEVTYTWDNSLGYASKWANDGTTLVSVIEDYYAQNFVTALSTGEVPELVSGSKLKLTLNYESGSDDITYGVKAMEAELNRKSNYAYYSTLVDAWNAAVKDNTISEIKLLMNASGAGLKIGDTTNSDVNITLDLGGNTYTVSTPAVGSGESKSQAIHLGPGTGNKVTIRNGSLTSDVTNKGIYSIINNYVDLTLNDVKVDATNATENNESGAALHTINGVVSLEGETILTVDQDDPKWGVAMRVYNVNSYSGSKVTVNLTGNGKIDGDVVFQDENGGVDNASSFILSAGTITGDIRYFSVYGIDVTLPAASEEIIILEKSATMKGIFTIGEAIFNLTSISKATTTGEYPLITKSGIAIPAGSTISGTVSFGSDSAELNNIKAGIGGMSISKGSIVIEGGIVSGEGTSDIVVSGKAEITGELDEGTTLTVTAGSTLTVTEEFVNNGTVVLEGEVSGADPKSAAQLKVEADAVYETGENGKVTDDSSPSGGDPVEIFPEFEAGSIVVYDDIAYTVYKYTSGRITLTYGLSCGDVTYTGYEITKYQVSVLPKALTTGWTYTNLSYDLVDDGTVYKDANTYKDHILLQINFVKSGTSGVAVNQTLDLVIKPAVVEVDFTATDTVFQNIDLVVEGSIVTVGGVVGYYNGDESNDAGYYIKLNLTEAPFGDLDLTYTFEEIGGYTIDENGDVLIYLGTDIAEAEAMTFEVSATVDTTETIDGTNFEVQKYTVKFDDDVYFVPLMTIGKLDGDTGLGKSGTTINGGLVVAGTGTEYTLSGEIPWVSGFTKFSSVESEQRGWYVAIKFTGPADWTGYSDKITILNENLHATSDGNYVLKLSDVRVNPVVEMMYDGVKTVYTIDVSGLEFGTVTGYGATAAEALAEMQKYGVTMTDVADDTMFMIFNALGNTAVDAVATSKNLVDGEALVYEEEIVDLGGRAAIWYFSFKDQASGKGVAGVYDLVIYDENGDNIAENSAVRNGIYTPDDGIGFDIDASIVDTKIDFYMNQNDPQNPVGDVDPNTFYWIYKAYEYSGSEFTFQMTESGQSTPLITDGVGINKTTLTDDGEKWHVFYFSFNNSSQVTIGSAEMYGKYDMTISVGEKKIAETELLVATDSAVDFSAVTGTALDKSVTDLITGTYTVDSTTTPGKVLFGGEIQYVKNFTEFSSIVAEQSGYYLPFNIKVGGNDVLKTYPDSVIKIYKDGELVKTVSNVVGEYNPFVFRVAGIDGVFSNFMVEVDFDGDGIVYKPSQYTLDLSALTKEVYTVDIFLKDPMYGENPIVFNSIELGKGFILPNGPDATQEFLGWTYSDAEGAPVYSGGSYIVITSEMVIDNAVTFTAVYNTDSGGSTTDNKKPIQVDQYQYIIGSLGKNLMVSVFVDQTLMDTHYNKSEGILVKVIDYGNSGKTYEYRLFFYDTPDEDGICLDETIVLDEESSEEIGVQISVWVIDQWVSITDNTEYPNIMEDDSMTFEIVGEDEVESEDENYPWLQINYNRMYGCDYIELFIDDSITPVDITNWVGITPGNVTANPDAYFQLSIEDGEITTGVHTFCILAIDGNVVDMISGEFKVTI